MYRPFQVFQSEVPFWQHDLLDVHLKKLKKSFHQNKNREIKFFYLTILILVIFEFITLFLDFFCEFIFKFVNLFRIRDFKMILEPIYFLKYIKKIYQTLLKLKGISFHLVFILYCDNCKITYLDIFFTNYEIFMLKIVIVAKISDESGATKLGFRVSATNSREIS